MADEYIFHSPRLGEFDTKRIEEKVQSLSHAFNCKVIDQLLTLKFMGLTAREKGERDYLITDDEGKIFIERRLEWGSSGSGLWALGDFIAADDEEVSVSCCCGKARVEAAVRNFCTWLVDEFGCSIKDELGKPSSIKKMFFDDQGLPFEGDSLQFFLDQLSCYFGVENDDQTAAQAFKQRVMGNPMYRDRVREALEHLLSTRNVQCFQLVEHYANRWANHSEDAARGWLGNLKQYLLG